MTDTVIIVALFELCIAIYLIRSAIEDNRRWKEEKKMLDDVWKVLDDQHRTMLKEKLGIVSPSQYRENPEDKNV